jgi:hypothetical protein
MVWPGFAAKEGAYRLIAYIRDSTPMICITRRWRQAHAPHRHCGAGPSPGHCAVALAAGRGDPAGSAAQSHRRVGGARGCPQRCIVRIETQRARSVGGLLACDRPHRWGALVTGVWTQRYARMRYVVTGLVPARIGVRPSNGLGAHYTPTLNSEMRELGLATSQHLQPIMHNNFMTTAYGRDNLDKPLNIWI